MKSETETVRLPLGILSKSPTTIGAFLPPRGIKSPSLAEGLAKEEVGRVIEGTT